MILFYVDVNMSTLTYQHIYRFWFKMYLTNDKNEFLMKEKLDLIQIEL